MKKKIKFTDVYNRVILYWGNSCGISDMVEQANGYYFKTLSALWSSVEQKVGHANPWDELMVWSMFQVFHREAVRCIKMDQDKIYFERIDKNSIQKKFYENLSSKTSDYSDLMTEYVNDLLSE